MRTLLQIYFSMSLTCCFSFVSVLYHYTPACCFVLWHCFLPFACFVLIFARVSPVAQKYASHIAYSIYNMCILCALVFYIRTHTSTRWRTTQRVVHTYWCMFVFRSYIHCLHTLWHFYAAKLCCIKFTVRMSNDSSCHQLATFVANIFVLVSHDGVVVLQAERHAS